MASEEESVLSELLEEESACDSRISDLELENEQLRQSNRQLSQKLEQLESQISENSSSASEKLSSMKREYEERIEDLQTRLRISVGGQKERQEKCEEAQQIEKEHWFRMIKKLQNQLEISQTSVKDLKQLLDERDAKCRDIERQSQISIDDMKTTERETLAAAGVFFHRVFSSLDELKAHFSARPVLKIQVTQPYQLVIDLAEKSSAKEKRMRKRLEEIRQQETEAVIAKAKVKAELDFANKDNDRLKNLLENSEKEVRKLNHVCAELAEREQELSELKQQTESQKTRIKAQQREISAIKSSPSAASQIAQLKCENEKLKDELINQMEEVKRMKPAVEIREVEPDLFWSDVEGAEVPSELRETLAKVIENQSLQIKEKFKHCMKTMASYYQLRQMNLQEKSDKHKRWSDLIMQQLSSFNETLGLLLIKKSVTVDQLAGDQSLQTQIIDAAKKLKSDLRDSVIENRKLQRSFPSEELACLRDKVTQQREKIHDLRKQNRDFRTQLPDADELKSLKKQLTRAENENEKLRTAYENRRFKDSISAKMSKLDNDIEAIKRESTEQRETEKFALENRIKCLEEEKADAEREIELLKRKCQSAAPPCPSPPLCPAVQELMQRIAVLEQENDKLEKELSNIKKSFIEKLKNAKVESIREYEVLVAQLKHRVKTQKDTIRELSQRMH